MVTNDESNRILLHGSSRQELASTANALESAGRAQLSVAAGIDEFTTMLSAQSFDVVIIDLDGITDEVSELVGAVRQRYTADALPVLLIRTGKIAETWELALAVGANDCLAKPIERSEASLRLRNLMALSRFARGKITVDARFEAELAQRTAKLDMLIEGGLMMSMERDPSKLLQHILIKGQRLLNCDAATIYLVTEQKTLRFAHRTKDDTLPSIQIPLYDPATGKPNERFVSSYAAVHNAPVVIDDVYQETRFDVTGTRRFDAESGYRTVSMLTVPMAGRAGEVVGVLQFLNALDPRTGAIIPFSPDIIALVEALAAQAAVALDNLQLVEAQRILVDNMIQVIATAIDAKSPYTGRHCSRVPELAVMLAETVSAADTGPLADFRFNSEEEWREFRIGAWLHDCGKVTTPEYVIDKATKLETIYNRIHEVRMRFEVLLRDAEIDCLRAIARGADATAAERAFEARKATLHDDFEFVARSNIGTERMTDDDIARLRRIARTTWMRHFDDRLGLSVAETKHYPTAPPQPLPIEEHLLADKSQHLIPREASDLPPAGFGFRMEVPEYLYHRGEIHNLCIRRGTLTEEERYKINEHMVFTIVMLEKMTFPKSLRRVPEYAGTHHETLTGTGYPRRLGAADLSIPARIMAIADVFEAVTASDRPYKKANKVSEAVKILHQMRMDGHIDGDIFDLFLSSGLHLRYAHSYLKPEQIDHVDITPYLGHSPAQQG